MMQSKRERIKYFVIQKLMGLVIIVLAIISCTISGDGTAAFALAPIGIYMIFDKRIMIMNTYYCESEEKMQWKN